MTLSGVSQSYKYRADRLALLMSDETGVSCFVAQDSNEVGSMTSGHFLTTAVGQVIDTCENPLQPV